MGFKERVLGVINSSDLILEILDARFPQETRNKALERIAEEKGKQIILVLNKSDLVGKEFAEKTKKELEKEKRCIFVSPVKRRGIGRLREIIAIEAKRKGRAITVGVIGYPNTGKSSIINSLSGRKKAGTSITAGFTRGEQIIRIGKEARMIDSPGVIPFEERDEVLLAVLSAKSAEKLKDAVSAAEKIIEILKESNPKALEKFYSIQIEEKDSEKIMEEIALKKGRLLKGGIADLEAIAKQIILDWQKGKIGKK